MIAATHHSPGTIIAGWVGHMPSNRQHDGPCIGAVHDMNNLKPREYCIQGLTVDGHTFRPSDWAERLAGAMSCFRPGGVQGGPGAYIGYSPLCVPRTLDGVRCVIVSEALKDVELLAWDFVMNFARDNQLTIAERVAGSAG